MSTVLSLIVIGILALIVYIFREQLQVIAGFFLLFAGICALIGWIFFDAAKVGAYVGCGIAAFVSIRYILDELNMECATALLILYYIVSFPIWLSNRLQHILIAPWRYIFKYCSFSDSTNDNLRAIFYFVQIILFFALTPLRIVNSIVYNIFVYGILEFYDLMIEVIKPSKWGEGYADWWEWTYMLPWRIIKYPIFHGILVLIDGIIWSVMEIIIPTETMYHGTDLTAAQAITGKYAVSWTDGTFSASKNGWAGKGVYFGSSRRTARGYAEDPYRLGDSNPVMIVCRVSLGFILNYNLAPKKILNNTGPYGDPAVINKYCDSHSYTTGEWWNKRAGYWEYCMLDWQNRYNYPWRIRPIYVFNFRTGRIQHIQGGVRHWLFSKVVFNDIIHIRGLMIVFVLSVIVSILIVLYIIGLSVE